MPHRVHPGSPACLFDCQHSSRQMHSDHVCSVTGSRPLLQKTVCPYFSPQNRQRRKWSRRDLEEMLEHGPEVASVPVPGRDRPVLVVDDDIGILGFVRAALEEEGYRVLTAGSGPEAVNQALTGHPGLVLLDISLPEMDGWSVAADLRDKLGDDYRLILMSAQRVNTDRARSLGAVDWISKPFGIGDLLQSVDLGRVAEPPQL